MIGVREREMMTSYPNWFEGHGFNEFPKHLEVFKGKPNLNFIQIGAYTGDASLWMLQNILTDPSSTLTDVDTWEGSEESIHKTFDWQNVEQVYDSKIAGFPNLIKKKMLSLDYLLNLEPETADFIYIDGDHTAKAVYVDASLSWAALKSGGILGFDDYTWEHDSGVAELAPRQAIDKFVSEHSGEFELLGITDQYWIKKK